MSDLLQKAGIKAEAKSIEIKSTDGFTKTMTREQLDAPRYYYPGLKENHEYFGYILGSTDNAVTVDTILALRSTDGNDPKYLGATEAPLWIMGQRWITEQTNEIFVKYVGKITVSTTAPGKWETPAADKESGTVPAGTQVALSTSNMDGDGIHYTTDGTNPTIESPMYNWIKKRWWGSRSDELATINHKIDVNRSMTLKAIAIGPGKTDSDIVTYEYKVTDAYPPTLIRDTSNVCVSQPIEITFSDDKGWTDAITAIKVDGTELSPDKYTVTSNKITLAVGVFTEAKDYTITIIATGFREASVVQKMVLENANANGLTADGTHNIIGQPIELTFADNADWRAAITEVSIDGTGLEKSKYTVESGKITIAAGVFTEAKDYTITIQAIGYSDSTVTQTIKKIPPVLIADTTDYVASQPIEITFTDDADWRAAIAEVSIDGTGLEKSKYTIESGKITIVPGVLSEVRDYTITIQANGYGDTTVIQTMWPDGTVPPVLTADTTNNIADQPMEITFTDDEAWRTAITKVNADGAELTSEKYQIESGKITIPANVFTVGDHTIVINATGYRNAVVIQPVVSIPPVLSPQTVNNGVNAKICITYTSNPAYKNAISAVLVDGNPLPTDKYSAILNGKITISVNVLNENKDYTIVVQAKGYLDATVTQPIKKAAPTLTAPYGYIGKAIQLTFTDDSTWREAVTAVSVDGKTLKPENYTLEAGKLTFPPGILNDVRSYANPYIIVISAKDGYADTSAEQKVTTGTAPRLIPDNTDNTIGQPIELTFTDDPYWRSVITAVKVDNVAIAAENYTFEAGKLTIKPGVFTQAKLYNVIIQAAGYNNSTISQTITEATSVTLSSIAITKQPTKLVYTVGDELDLTGLEVTGTYSNSTTKIETVMAENVTGFESSTAVESQTLTITIDGKTATYTIEIKAKPDIPQYKVIPAEDVVYTIGATPDGIKTMTVKENQTGFNYFTVSIETVKAHEGTEAAVFTHLRNDVQLELNAVVADFDVVNTAKAGFNVKPGDVIKVYIVDQLTNDANCNPVILQ